MVSSAITSLMVIGARPLSRSLLDAAIAVAALAGTLTLVRHGGIGPARPGAVELDLVAIALAASSTVPIIAWRRFPLAVFLVTGASSVVLAGLGYRIDLLLGPAVALYLMAASREPTATWPWRSTASVLGLLVAYLAATANAQRAIPDIELVHTGLAWAVAWFAGERARLRRAQLADVIARADRTQREAEQDRLLAASEERARIARDLHDSAGHAINVIAVRAGAARLRHHEHPERSLAALEAIEELARQTAEEIDQIVGTLRERGSATRVIEAPSGLASLDTLVRRHREAGLEVTIGASGERRRLPPAIDQAAYRILQEALTNAARHGTGSAEVHVAFNDESLELTVTNPMRASPLSPPTGGHGLIGMRERATMLGGTLYAKGADGIFRVLARLAYGSHQE